MSSGALVCGSADAPSVMLIHGLASSHRVWDRVVPMIAGAARVYAVELNAGPSIDADADAVARLIAQPTLIVGHSRGALVATAIAERHPTRVNGLILISPPWSSLSRRAARRLNERALTVPVLGDLLWTLAPVGYQRKAVQSAFAPGTTVTVPDRFVADMRARARRRFVESSRARARRRFVESSRATSEYLRADALASRLRNLSISIQLVFGDTDQRVSLPNGEFSGLDNTRLTVLTQTGHTPPWEAGRDIAELILNTIGAAGRR